MLKVSEMMRGMRAREAAPAAQFAFMPKVMKKLGSKLRTLMGIAFRVEGKKTYSPGDANWEFHGGGYTVDVLVTSQGDDGYKLIVTVWEDGGASVVGKQYNKSSLTLSDLQKESTYLPTNVVGILKGLKRTAGYRAAQEGEADKGQELATLLKKRFRNVKYDPKRQVGSADVGQISVSWETSSNDDAVSLIIKQNKKVKAFDMPETVKILDQIGKALGKF